MKKVLILAAVLEAGIALPLIIDPTLVLHLLTGADLNGVGVIAGRMLGISLIGLVVGSWPANGSAQPVYGFLTYLLLSTLYMIAVGISGYVGILLWPATITHAIFAVLLGRGLWQQRKNPAI